MAKEKVYIVDMFNGVPLGYIKSVSYTKGNYKLTQNKADAKGYTTQYAVQNEIDALAKIAGHTGHVFIYD